MANPQTEEGHIDIAHDIAEALMRINLSAYESRVLWFIFRKTYGWKKKMDWITLSQFSTCIGLDRRLIHRAITELSSKGMIVIERDDSQRLRYGFQKDYEKWTVDVKKRPHSKKEELNQCDKSILSSKGMIVIERDDELSSKGMTRLSSKGIHTKETITKETITKEKAQAPRLPEWIPQNTFQEYLEMRRKIRKPLLEKSFPRFFSHLKKLCDTTRASPEQLLDQSIINSWQGIFPLKVGGNGNGGIRTARSDPRDRTLQSREDAEIAAIIAKREAAKQSARSHTGGDATTDDAPDFSNAGLTG